MNIRKKLIIANSLMILIPIAVSLLLCFSILFYSGNGTLNRLKNMYENDNGLLNVQTILYNYKDQILSYEPAKEEEGDDDDWEELREEEEEEQKEAFGDLIKELNRLGYYYDITYNDQTILCNLPKGASKKISSLAGSGYKELNSLSLANEKESLIKRTYQEEKKKIEVMVYCDEYGQTGSETSQVIREIVSLVGIFVGVLLVTIITSIFVLTRWVSGGMKKTLEQLSEGVKQVQDGNLSYRIRSKKKDELGKACREFDEMAAYLEQSVEEKERYEEARKQMLAGISHDLRTPLTSVKAYVEGLKDGIANTEEKKQRYYDALQIRIGDLESLIDNLSLFSRFDRKEYHYVMEKIEISSFLESFFEENQIEFQKNKIKIEKNIWPSEKLYIEGDRKQLKRILDNLADNTIKYREKEETVWTVSLREDTDRIFLEIADDGPGIQEEERSRIFDTFYRGDKARQNPGNGSGLGLAIVKEILKGHGACIRAAESEPGEGLKIIIEFPAKKGEII